MYSGTLGAVLVCGIMLLQGFWNFGVMQEEQVYSEEVGLGVLLVVSQPVYH